MTFLRFFFRLRVADGCGAAGAAGSASDVGLAGRRPWASAAERIVRSTLVEPAAAGASGCCGAAETTSRGGVAGDAVAAARWGVRAGSGRSSKDISLYPAKIV